MENYRPKEYHHYNVPRSPQTIPKNQNQNVINLKMHKKPPKSSSKKIKRKLPLTIMNVDVGDNQPKKIYLYENTDPIQKASEFVDMYGIPEEMLGTLSELIKSNKEKAMEKRERRRSREVVIKSKGSSRRSSKKSMRDTFRQYSTPRSKDSARSHRNRNVRDSFDRQIERRINSKYSSENKPMIPKLPISSKKKIENPNRGINFPSDRKKSGGINFFGPCFSSSNLFLKESKNFDKIGAMPQGDRSSHSFKSNIQFTNKMHANLKKVETKKNKPSRRIFGSSYLNSKVNPKSQRSNNNGKFSSNISKISGQPIIQNDPETGEYFHGYAESGAEESEEFNVFIPQFDSFTDDAAQKVQEKPPGGFAMAMKQISKKKTANFESQRQSNGRLNQSGEENYIDDQVGSINSQHRLSRVKGSSKLNPPIAGGFEGSFSRKNIPIPTSGVENQSKTAEKNPFFSGNKKEEEINISKRAEAFRQYSNNYQKMQRSESSASVPKKFPIKRRQSMRRASIAGNRKFRFKIQNNRNHKIMGVGARDEIKEEPNMQSYTQKSISQQSPFVSNNNVSQTSKYTKQNNNQNQSNNMNALLFESISNNQEAANRSSSRISSTNNPKLVNLQAQSKVKLDDNMISLIRKVFSTLDFENRGSIRSYDVYLCDFESNQKDFLHQVLSQKDNDEQFSNISFQQFKTIVANSGKEKEFRKLFG